MSGLIWGGIGQGLANAGQTIGGMMMKDIEYQRQLEAEERKENNYIKRLEEAQRIKDEAAEVKAEALQQRVIQETTAAQAAGAEAPAARMAGQLKTVQGQIAGESPAMSEAEIQQLIKENPQYKKVYEEAGYVTKRDERRERAEGAILSAMAAGAHSTTKKDLEAQRIAVMKEIGDEFKEDKETAYRAQQATQNEARDKRLELLAQDVKTRERNADTYANKPGRAGGGSDKDPIFKTITGNDGIEYGIRRSGEKVPLGESSKFNDQISKDIQRMAKNDPKFAKLEPADQRERALALRTPAASAAEPATEKAPPKPALASIKNAPPGSTAVGDFVAGRGYEIKDRTGKVLGYVRN